MEACKCEHFENLAAKWKIFLCKGISAVADDIDAVKEKAQMRFPFTEAADLIPNDEFELTEKMII